jgi:hypothetical protein
MSVDSPVLMPAGSLDSASSSDMLLIKGYLLTNISRGKENGFEAKIKCKSSILLRAD